MLRKKKGGKKNEQKMQKKEEKKQDKKQMCINAEIHLKKKWKNNNSKKN